MLKLYNPSGQRIGAIEHYQNLCVEEEISQLNVISFEVPKSESDLIDFEGYVETEKDGRYVIKEKTSNNDTMEFKGIYDLEELSGFIESKAYVSLSLSDMMKDILVGTGWDFQTSDTSIKTASGVTIDRLDLIYAIVRDTFGLEIRFDNQAKVITAEHHLGSDKGVYFHDEVNLVELKVDGDTYDFATRIIPRGADGLSIESVNGGLPYLENTQHSSKIITRYWSDERYTVPERLMAAAQDKLDILSKPLKSYSAQVVDLSRVSKMTILEYSPGDVITLQDRESGIKEKQRIVLRKKYLDEPERDTVTIANRLRQIDDSIKTEFDGMKQDFSVIRASLQLLDQKVLARVTKNEYDTDKEAMDLAYAELGLSIDGLEAEVLDIDGNIGALGLAAQELEGRIQNAEGDIGALELTAQNFQVSLGNIEDEVAGVKFQITPESITETVENNTSVLAKKAEVELVDDAWKAAFYESVSGGENILEKTETMENWSVFTGATLNTSQGWVYILANGSFPYGKTQTKIRKNEKYVFSVDLYTTNLNTASAIVTHWRVVGAPSWNKTTHDVSANTGAWVRVSMPIFVAGSGDSDIEISVDCYGATSGEIWYRRPQLEQGDLFSGWKPSSKELYSGITKINKDGINVSVSSSSVNTQVAYDGLTIKDGDSILASFGEVGSVVPFLSANHIVSPSTVGIVYDQTVTVGPGKQYSTINDALNGVFGGGFRYIRNQITFDIYGDISEIVEVNSLIGGRLILQFRPASKLYGRIFIRNCMSEIDIISYDNSSVANMGLVRPPSGAGIGIDIVNCTHVYIRGIILAGTNAYQGMKIQRGGVLFVRDCDFSGLTDTAVLAADGSLAMMTDNKGSNAGWAGWAYPGGRIYATGMIPNSVNGIGADRGFTWLSGTTSTPSSYSPPAVTSKTFTQTFTSATFDTLVHGTSNSNPYYGASAAQNRWDGSVSWCDGRIRFGPEIYNFFAGGTGIQVQIRLRRKNSSHGNSGAVMPAPYNHSASFPSGATRGGWTGWATIPSSLFTTEGATLTYYNGVQGLNGYAIWDAVEVWVSVTKNV